MHRGRPLALLSLVATLITLFVAMTIIEVWVRANWDPRRGRPGLFVADARRGQRLAPGYDGWFAGVPVRINNLGFRDAENYSLAKSARTYRILLLGDSVTFGHGASYETTYPYLLKERLQRWRPETDWQVWNLGVPGYNTGQELSQLLELGPAYHPDLVIVGFFENDLDGNDTAEHPGPLTRTSVAIRNALESRLYSVQLYKRLALTIAWKLSGRSAFHDRLDNLATLEALSQSKTSRATGDRLFPVTPGDPPEACRAGIATEAERQARLLIDELRTTNRWNGWTQAVRGFGDLNRRGVYDIVFFLNLAPEIDDSEDRFCDGGTRRLNDYFISFISQQMPVVSAYDAIGRYKPSEMPLAKGHSTGNTNAVKADVLFAYLRTRMAR